MDALSFNNLDNLEQLELTLKGTFLADRLTEAHYVKLYHLDSFYVEMYFDDSSHIITKLHAFEDTSLLIPYLDPLKLAM